MGGKAGFRSYPRHLGKPHGKGVRVCDRSGMLRNRADTTREYTGSTVATDFADLTPGFGTRHPQDVNQAQTGGDPSPIPNARPIQAPVTKSSLGISDQEIEAAIKENRQPRRGY